MKNLYIHAYHGRVHPDEALEDWGFDGPLIGPLEWFHTVYGNHRYAFSRAGIKNALAFGFSESDAQDVDVDERDGYFFFDGFYFGDWSVVIADDREAKRRNEQWFAKGRMEALSRQALFLRDHKEQKNTTEPLDASAG